MIATSLVIKAARISVTGYCIYVLDCLVAWKSRSQKHVTLSSTEAHGNHVHQDDFGIFGNQSSDANYRTLRQYWGDIFEL